ncbi:MAG: membrane protein insertase YidC [Candidatus Omnitrophota bacterium]
MKESHRQMLAITLIILVVFGYQKYATKGYKKAPVAASAEILQKPEVLAPSVFGIEKEGGSEAFYPEEEYAVETDLYRAVFTSRGAGIKSFYLKKYTDGNGKEMPLLIEEQGLTLLHSKIVSPSFDSGQWQLAEATRNKIVFVLEDKKFVVRKEYLIDESSYIINMKMSVLNNGNKSMQFNSNLTGAAAALSNGFIDKRYFLADVKLGDKTEKRHLGNKKLLEGEVFQGNPVWISVRARYYSFILDPLQPETASFLSGKGKDVLSSGIIIGPKEVGPNESAIFSYNFYAGPNVQEEVTKLGPEFKKYISYGLFSGIARFLLKTLGFFYMITGNYGIAIILMTLCVSIALFPLTRKSFSSIKEMQKIQPLVEKIRKECADNPQKMNKEVMALYKEHKVNPLGGCLPMFLQFPVFISLYQVLGRSIELKGAAFLWIKDLAEPDAAFLLHAKFPVIGNQLNILPLLMIGAMIVQQKVSQPKGGASNEQQKMMAFIFPIVLGVVFYNLPSGLVLYWVTNTVITLLVQEVFLKTKLN